MATIGLSKPYYALYQESGGTVTYSGGGLIGKATEMSLELEGADANILYADNGPAESDNQFAGGTVPRYYGIAPDTDRITLSPVDHKDTGVYKVLQVQHVMDNDGLSATDITLERTGALDGST